MLKTIKRWQIPIFLLQMCVLVVEFVFFKTTNKLFLLSKKVKRKFLIIIIYDSMCRSQSISI